MLAITTNDLMVRNQAFSSSGLSLSILGPWETWIFVFALIVSVTFAYFFFKVTNDTKRFHKLIQGSSKHNFVKNLRELQKISKNLGPKYESILEESMQKWKVK